MRKNIQKLLLAAFVMAATFILAPSVDAKAYGITQVNPAADSVTVTWEAEEDATAYNVYIGADYETAALYTTLPATSTSVTIPGLVSGAEYFVKVTYTHVNYQGLPDEGPVGYEYDVRTIPTAVTGVRQEKWWYFIKSFDVVWDDLGAADSYEYVIENSKGKTMKTGTVTYENCDLSKVSNSMVYRVKVRATSTICGQTYTTPWTDWAYCFTQPRVKSVKVSGNKLVVKWDKITGVTGYDIYVSTKPTTDYVKVKSVGKNKSSFTVKKLKGKKFKKNKKYYVYVASTKKVGGVKYDSGRLYYWNSKGGSYGYF